MFPDHMWINTGRTYFITVVTLYAGTHTPVHTAVELSGKERNILRDSGFRITVIGETGIDKPEKIS